MQRIIVLAICSIAICATAHAAKTTTINTSTAGDLADVCGAKPGQPGADRKQTYCQGFAQGAISVALRSAGQDKPFCFPRPAPSRADTMRQFVGWVAAAPERRSLPSTDGLLRFLQGRYPCKAQQGEGATSKETGSPK